MWNTKCSWPSKSDPLRLSTQFHIRHHIKRSPKVSKPQYLCLNCPLTLKLDRYLGSMAVKAPVKFQSRSINFSLNFTPLTHWGWVTHICVSKQTTIGSDNGLSPGRRQAIIWTNAGILLIGTLGTNFSEILIEIRIFSFKKMGLNVSSAIWWPFCLGLNVLKLHEILWWDVLCDIETLLIC